MGGLVGVIAQESARFSTFSASLTSLDLPERSAIRWWLGHDIAENCNVLVREMYEQEKDWLWLLGDDHTFAPGVLKKLLAWNVDIVVPLCVQRQPPYAPVIHSGWAERGAPWRQTVDLDQYPDGGMIAVHSAGSGGMLIQRRVFDSLSDPWFESGVVSATQLAEDLYFCDKAREAGAQIYCDLDTRIGHSMTAAVWPVKEESGWTCGFMMSGGFQIVMPPGMKTAQ